MIETKICKKCGKEFPRTEKYFNKLIKNTDGLKGTCKQCLSEYDKQYRKKNAERLADYLKNNAKHTSERDKQYRKDHSEHIAKYYKSNINHILECRKQYYKSNTEHITERSKQYYKDNTEIVIRRNKQYRKNNIEKIAKYKRQYAKENIEQHRISWQRRVALKKQLPSTLTLAQWENIKNKFNNKCCYCGKELPLAQEHFLALSKCGEYTVNNIIPSCKSCNSSKCNRDFFVWYPKYEHYSIKREKFILKFLNYKDGLQQLKII